MVRIDTRVAIAALFVTCLTAGPAFSQVFSGDWNKELLNDQPAAKNAAQKKVEADILGMQAALRAAAKARNKAEIERYYAPDFTMTHGAGAIHDKKTRVDFIAATGGGYEPMTPEVQSIRVLGPDAAVSIANNSGKIAGQAIYIRYLIVYSKGKPSEGYKGWREAAAQVTMIKVPESALPPAAAAAPAH